MCEREREREREDAIRASETNVRGKDLVRSTRHRGVAESANDLWSLDARFKR